MRKTKSKPSPTKLRTQQLAKALEKDIHSFLINEIAFQDQKGVTSYTSGRQLGKTHMMTSMILNTYVSVEVAAALVSKLKFEKVPLYINHEDKYVREGAMWRMRNAR